MKNTHSPTLFSNDKQKLLAYILAEEKIEFSQINSIARSENPRNFHLSFAQERLWFLDQLSPQNPVYNIPIALHIDGLLKITVLEKCLNTITQRHETLRSRFKVEKNQDPEIVFSANNFPLIHVNLERFTADHLETLIPQYAVQEAQTPFDLTQAFLVRAKLLRLSPDAHTLLMTMHHTIADGWSLGVLVKELAVQHILKISLTNFQNCLFNIQTSQSGSDNSYKERL